MKHEIYWYQQSVFVRNAFLYHCRDDDLIQNPTARIPRGAIVAAQFGFVAAENAVPGFEATIVPFLPSRRCEWQGVILECMVHASAPSGSPPKSSLRPFNNIVACLSSPEWLELALSVGVPVITTADGVQVVNLELGCFQKQGKNNSRRAKLI